MMKYVIAFGLGALTFCILVNPPRVSDLEYQIQQRDSVNAINIERNKELEEFIRLDSLTMLKQLEELK